MTAKPKVEILTFTDPFCSWCWAMEPVIYRAKETYRDQLRIRPVMGGLVPDMAHFTDPLNGISSTADVAPHWEEVGLRTGQPIDGTFMRENQDPHWGTWPACIAASAAALQGDDLGEAFLRRLRRAAQAEGRNASSPEVYQAIAEATPGLDLDRFKAAIADGTAERAFQEDRQLGAQVRVRSFPTFLVMNTNADLQIRPILMGGARDFKTLQDVLSQVAPDLKPHAPRPLTELLAEYGALTTRELSELLDKPISELLAELEGQDGIRKVPVRTGEFWELGQADVPTLGKSLLTDLVSWEDGGMACGMETGVCGPVSAEPAKTEVARS
ncbi:DSBA-like thioredoxin domain protein [compost metagenome]